MLRTEVKNRVALFILLDTDSVAVCMHRIVHEICIQVFSRTNHELLCNKGKSKAKVNNIIEELSALLETNISHRQ